jgi:hypothetical protein
MISEEVQREREACAFFLKYLDNALLYGSRAPAAFEWAKQHDLISQDDLSNWHVDPGSVCDALLNGEHLQARPVITAQPLPSPLSEAATMTEKEEISKFEGDRGH